MPCPGSTTPTSASAISSETATCGSSTNSSSCTSSRSRMLCGSAAGKESNQLDVIAPTSSPVTNSTPESARVSESASPSPATPLDASSASCCRRSRRRALRRRRRSSVSVTAARVFAPSRGLRTRASSFAPGGRLRRFASSSDNVSPVSPARFGSESNRRRVASVAFGASFGALSSAASFGIHVGCRLCWIAAAASPEISNPNP